MLLQCSTVILLLFHSSHCGFKLDLQNTGELEEIEEEDNSEDDSDRPIGKDVYGFLAKRMKQDVGKKQVLTPRPYRIPGPQEPLPGRSHFGDYWPVFPFQNQYSGGVDLDPAISRHLGGDVNFAIPSWGMFDMYGRFYYRIHDTTTKVGYLNHPVNMMDLEKEDLMKLMGDPAVNANRQAHPTLPLGVFAKRYAPMNCKPPMCNPYQMTFGLGIEHDFGGFDGVEGDIDVPMPISKGIAYRFPFSGNVYAFPDNITVTYGQNLSPIEPFSSLFDYQKHRDPALRIPRKWEKRSIEEYPVEQIRRYKERMIESRPAPMYKIRQNKLNDRQLFQNYQFIPYHRYKKRMMYSLTSRFGINSPQVSKENTPNIQQLYPFGLPIASLQQVDLARKIYHNMEKGLQHFNYQNIMHQQQNGPD